MQPNPPFGEADLAGSDTSDSMVLNDLAAKAAEMGSAIVDVAGFLDEIEGSAQGQLSALGEVNRAADQIVTANSTVQQAIGEVADAGARGKTLVEGSLSGLQAAGERTRGVAAWVHALEARMSAVEKTLGEVETSNLEVAGIAKQVNILAINAKIEAARAGDSGRGFAVVAEAINELSQQTARAADRISDAIQSLAGSVGTLKTEAEGVSAEASAVIDESEQTDRTLGEIASQVEQTARVAEEIAGQAASVGQAIDAFRPAFDSISSAVENTASGLVEARDRTHGMVDISEAIVHGAVEVGGAAEDARFIAYVKDHAEKIGTLFSDSVTEGRVSQSALFSSDYRPIPGTNPEQVMAPFTPFTDRVLPAIQEAALDFDPKIVFCAAVDRNGYLPTHNRKFSQPQGTDVDWNTAHSRNRRIFDDRVGLKAGRNMKSFLLQIYRRDMGGGEFVLMKDLSAPIVVNGRHWGGLRLAYRL